MSEDTVNNDVPQQLAVNGDVPQQPRQPKDMQGLMRFAIEATKAEDAPTENSELGPMDDRKKQFLEEALKSLSVDVVQIIQDQIKVLQNADNLAADADIANHNKALETILEYVGDIDIANDFYKIGGFAIFEPCLRSVHPAIRAGACEVLAEISQNNPCCQRVVMDYDLVYHLLRTLETDADLQVCIKALYAISCIVRQNSEAYHHLVQYQGYGILLKTLKRDDEKLTTKTTFLLSSLVNSQDDVISRLEFMGYVPVLIKLVSGPHKRSHEHVLSLLAMMVEENQQVATECKNPEHNFKEVLTNHLNLCRNKPEFQEEEDCCRRLFHSLQFATGFANGIS